MLPVYLSYFAGGELSEPGGRKRRMLVNAVGFVLGFTAIFVLLGAAAGTFGMFVRRHETVFQIAGGLILIVFGLNYMSVVHIGFLERTFRMNVKIRTFNFASSVLLGIVFSIGWTPCVGAFLGSALMLAASSREALKGVVMLLLFSLGLGVPFVLSAVLIGSLRRAFDALKRRYRLIRVVSGALLVAVGVLMMLGRMNAFLSLLTFRSS